MKVNIQKLTKRLFPLVVAAFVLVLCIAPQVSAAGQEPWNYEDYIHDIEYDDGYNNVLVEIPQWVSYLEVRYRESGVQYWQEKTYGTLLQGRWPSQYSKFSGWFNPVDSLRPLDISNVPNGSLLRVQISLSGFNFDFDGFSMILYYLDSNYQTLREERYWQDYQSHGDYVIDFDIQKPTGARYVCVQCPVSAIFPDPVGGNFQIEFTRTQLVMGIDALYFQQQMIEKNNKLLDEVDKHLQENGQRLDDLINGTPEQNEQVDGVVGGIDGAVDDFENSMNGMQDATLPPVEFDDYVPFELSGDEFLHFAAVLGSFWTNTVLARFMSILGGIILISFILFGEKH